MLISPNMILSALSGLRFEAGTAFLASPGFSWASLLTSDRSRLVPEKLYICTREDAEELHSISSSYCTIYVDSGSAPLTSDCAVVIRDELSLTELAARVQNHVSAIWEWMHSIEMYCTENGDYQPLMDMSEKLLVNPMYVLDASYKLLAYTKGNTDDDEIDVKLRKNGYHDEETFKKFKDSNRFQVFNFNVGIIFNKPGNPNKYATIGKWIWSDGMPVIHIIMICSVVEAPDQGIIDLFEMLTQYCSRCFFHNQSQRIQTGRYYDSLLNDIVFGELNNLNTIEDRARIANIPSTGAFLLFKIMMRDNDSFPILRLMHELAATLPSSWAISRAFEVIILNRIPTDASPFAASREIELVRKTLNQRNAVCGVSGRFNHLAQMQMAYRQATSAISIGEPISLCQEAWQAPACELTRADTDVFFYDNNSVYAEMLLAKDGDPDVFLNSYYRNLVKSLLRKDQEENTNNAEVLRVFLINERRASRAGELLHMHRNNVLYRVRKIEEMLSLSLDDYWVRMKLLLAFHFAELEIAQKSGDHSEDKTIRF